MKSQARSIENGAESFMVLTSNPTTKESLKLIAEYAMKMQPHLKALYNDVAPEAMR